MALFCFFRSSLDPIAGPVSEEDGPLVYTVEERGTPLGRRRLTDSLGFSYRTNRAANGTTYWICSVNSKKRRCNVTVIEKSGNFHTGANSTHNHPARIGRNRQTWLRYKEQVTRQGIPANPFSLGVQH